MSKNTAPKKVNKLTPTSSIRSRLPACIRRKSEVAGKQSYKSRSKNRVVLRPANVRSRYSTVNTNENIFQASESSIHSHVKSVDNDSNNESKGHIRTISVFKQPIQWHKIDIKEAYTWNNRKTKSQTRLFEDKINYENTKRSKSVWKLSNFDWKSDLKQETLISKRKSARKHNKSYGKYIPKVISFSIDDDDDDDSSTEKSAEPVKVNPEIDLTIFSKQKFCDTIPKSNGVLRRNCKSILPTQVPQLPNILENLDIDEKIMSRRPILPTRERTKSIMKLNRQCSLSRQTFANTKNSIGIDSLTK